MNKPGAARFDNYLMALYAAYLLLLLPVQLLVDKGDVVLWVNSWHAPAFDVFFKYFTHLGDGIIFPFFIIVLLFVRYEHALLALLVAIGHGLIIYLFKKILFSGAIRPLVFFEDVPALQLVDGVVVHSHRSFPSGHTASAFVVALVLTLVVRKKSWATVFLVAAILIGLSRIYLLQHFFMDVYTGSAIGIFTVLLVWLLMENHQPFQRAKWPKSSLRQGFVHWWQASKKKDVSRSKP